MVRALFLLLAFVVPGAAEAASLCITRGGTVKARVACRRKETPLNPADFGLCGCGGTTTTTLPSGVCAFKGTTCTSDAECSIPGVCFAGSPGGIFPPGSCLIRCTSNADCTPQTFCFQSGELGGICVGCGQPGSEDNSKCAPDMTCVANDCHQLSHPECTVSGTGCFIRQTCS
jgi:hypothetical protein